LVKEVLYGAVDPALAFLGGGAENRGFVFSGVESLPLFARRQAGAGALGVEPVESKGASQVLYPGVDTTHAGGFKGVEDCFHTILEKYTLILTENALFLSCI